MVDLQGQYHRLKEEIDAAMQAVIESSAFINGPQVKAFSDHLAEYLDIPHVIPCGNGTDALQIALMALGLQSGDEVIVPAFTYVAAAEVIALLGLTPVLVDVDPHTYNIDPRKIEESISRNTKAIIAVHLFGQSCDMDPILKIAAMYHLYVVEDNAQSIGAEYTFPDGRVKKTGTMGIIGTTSFFPSKPLACYGDGGALTTSDENLAKRIRMIANHGQKVKYHHSVLGCNSRLDTLQAAILDVKLKHLDEYGAARYKAAQYYTRRLSGVEGIITPAEMPYSTHVYHQYTLKVLNGRRDVLKKFLEEGGIPAMIYYPLSLQQQEAFKPITRAAESLDMAEQLAYSVLSLPIHTEMTPEQQDLVIERIKEFYKS